MWNSMVFYDFVNFGRFQFKLGFFTFFEYISGSIIRKNIFFFIAVVFNLWDTSFPYFIYKFIEITRNNCIKNIKRNPWYVLSQVFSKVSHDDQTVWSWKLISMVSAHKALFSCSKIFSELFLFIFQLTFCECIMALWSFDWWSLEQL